MHTEATNPVQAVNYYVMSQGLQDGPFDDLSEAVEFLFKLCGSVYAPPERIASTVVFSVKDNYGDVVKLYGKTLNGNYAQSFTLEETIVKVIQSEQENKS